MNKKKILELMVVCVLMAIAILSPVSCGYVVGDNNGSQDAECRSAAKPFPQHVTYAGSVIKPTNVTQTQMDTAVQTHYNAWKTNYVGSLSTSPVQKWIKFSSTETVSEAMGYGMVIAAYMGDQTDFDAMYYYTLAHPSPVNGTNTCLLAWKQLLQNGQMIDSDGTDSATDGDLDVAYALILADAQWGSAGTINYKARALNVLHDILSYEVNQSEWILLCGNWAESTDTHTRPSDFMIEHLLVFAEIDTVNSTKWTNIYNKINTIVNYQYNTGGSINTGLVPDFMVKSGSNYVPVTGEYLEKPQDGDFDYNACRDPWRLAMAYITKGETALLAQQQKQASWIRTKTSGTPTNIMAGYYVKNGTNGNAYVDYDELCFTAPFAVNAMIGGSSGQSWMNSLWTSITGGNYAATTGYYGDAIRMQCLLVISGNWWLPTNTITYTISASAGSNGTISPSGSVSVNQGANQTFTITPNSGYEVNAVTVDGSSQGAITSYTFSNVAANHTISATFKTASVTQYTITASAGSNGSISPSGSILVNQGANQTFTITPNSGYEVDVVTVDGVSQGAITSYTFTNVLTGHTINATFKTASAGSNIAPSGTGYVWAGMTSSTANTGKTAKPGVNDTNTATDVPVATTDNANAWEGVGVTWASSKNITSVKFINGTVNSSGDGYYEANFKLQFSSDGTTWSDSGWTVSPSYPYTNSASGQTYTCSGTQVTGKKGVRVVGQVRYGSVASSWYVVTRELQAFGEDSATYVITSSAGTNGSISPSGTLSVAQGASQTFTITSDGGYQVSSVTVDGTNQGAITSYTFSNVSANHTISASFAVQTSSNIADEGTGYVWKNNTSSTSNSNKSAKTGVNNLNFTTNVDISTGDSANRWEAAGVTFSSSRTISSVVYHAGDVTSGGDGYFEANAKLQFSTDGSTWTDSGWSVSPAFTYSSSDGGGEFTFSGSQISGIRGVRVVGQVRVNDSSYYARVREVEIFGQ